MSDEEIKTVCEWLEELPDGIRERALRNMYERVADTRCYRWGALVLAFSWSKAPEGAEFWFQVSDAFKGLRPDYPPLPGEEDEPKRELIDLEPEAPVEEEKTVKEIKNIREWFHELPPGYRERALQNMYEKNADRRCYISSALGYAFNWTESPEGFEFWWEVSMAFKGLRPDYPPPPKDEGGKIAYNPSGQGVSYECYWDPGEEKREPIGINSLVGKRLVTNDGGWIDVQEVGVDNNWPFVFGNSDATDAYPVMWLLDEQELSEGVLRMHGGMELKVVDIPPGDEIEPASREEPAPKSHPALARVHDLRRWLVQRTAHGLELPDWEAQELLDRVEEIYGLVEGED